MGVYDRDYYQQEGPSFLGPETSATTWILIATVICFLGQILSNEFTVWLVLVPEYVLQGQVWRLVTYAFLHDPHSLWHIAINMYTFWLFGRQIEPIYGRREFAFFYLVSALVGGIAFTAAWAVGGQLGICLGASGAVTAVLVLTALHFPRQIILLFFLIPVPLWLLAAGYVALDALTFVGGNNTPVAVVVHLGGALFAYIYYKGQFRLTAWLIDFRGWTKRLARPRLKVYRQPSLSSTPAGSRPASAANEHLEADLDRVLAKVAQYGQSSLTDAERKVLLQASEIYKRRRT
jgi:membrane associated rhomboid family serine protease